MFRIVGGNDDTGDRPPSQMMRPTSLPTETVPPADALQPANVARKVAREGVLVSVWTPTRLRIVLHLDVSEDEARTAALALLDALDEAWRELGDTSDWPIVTSVKQ